VSGEQPAADLLAAIVAAARARVAWSRSHVPLERLVDDPSGQRSRGFRAALARRGGLHVIAECKRRSPSKGVLRWQYDPAAIAAAYERAGAAAVSVLTEPAFFDGDLDHLRAVRAAVALPVLRKDFVIDAYQIWEARAAGADAVLLIAAALDQPALVDLLAAARRSGLDALVEVHDESELDRALAAGADLVGVNNRNLRTLAVDLDASRRLAALMPRDVVAVAESGLRTGNDLRELQALGYRAFLVGERFMTAHDPGAALAALMTAAEDGGTVEEGASEASVSPHGAGARRAT
jgi:indole-3-glycerol phosphate synthase